MIKKLNKEQMLIAVLALILLVVVFLPIPENETDKVSVSVPETEKNVVDEAAQQLQEILGKIAGVGKVEVLITYADDGRVIIEKDESVSEELVQEADANGGVRTTTTTRNDRESVYEEDAPYVIQELAPTVQGVLVVAEGAGNAAVKSQIQEAIEALFGLDAHKISIMKMEVSK